MNILAVDDEQLALEALEDALREAAPESCVHAFRKPKEALTSAAEHPYDVAFLDVEMRSMTGLQLAAELQRLNPQINVVFVTGFADYALDAMSLHASGYVTKPVTTQKVASELADLRYRKHPSHDKGTDPRQGAPLVTASSAPLLTVRCFGSFEVLHDGRPLHFSRSRAKEAFAYLVHRHGAASTTRHLATVLFEDAPYDKAHQSYIQSITSSLMNALEKAGARNCIIKDFNSIAVRTDALDCDYYRYLAGDTRSLNNFTGEYMNQYSWAEETAGYLARLR